jgi:hypothetical protein
MFLTPFKSIIQTTFKKSGYEITPIAKQMLKKNERAKSCSDEFNPSVYLKREFPQSMHDALEQTGGRAKVGWDSNKKELYLRITDKDGHKAPRIAMCSGAKGLDNFQTELTNALKPQLGSRRPVSKPAAPKVKATRQAPLSPIPEVEESKAISGTSERSANISPEQSTSSSAALSSSTKLLLEEFPEVPTHAPTEKPTVPNFSRKVAPSQIRTTPATRPFTSLPDEINSPKTNPQTSKNFSWKFGPTEIARAKVMDKPKTREQQLKVDHHDGAQGFKPTDEELENLFQGNILEDLTRGERLGLEIQSKQYSGPKLHGKYDLSLLLKVHDRRSPAWQKTGQFWEGWSRGGDIHSRPYLNQCDDTLKEYEGILDRYKRIQAQLEVPAIPPRSPQRKLSIENAKRQKGHGRNFSNVSNASHASFVSYGSSVPEVNDAMTGWIGKPQEVGLPAELKQEHNALHTAVLHRKNTLNSLHGVIVEGDERAASVVSNKRENIWTPVPHS